MGYTGSPTRACLGGGVWSSTIGGTACAANNNAADTSGGGTNVGAIVGGVIGGLACLALIGLALFVMSRKGMLPRRFNFSNVTSPPPGKEHVDMS